MIPKIIHFCWLSDEPLPPNLQKCINSWKKIMPDYTIKKWDTTQFDINSIPLVQQAYQQKKWAFAADYIRIFALYNEGGIYLDSDVMLYQRLDTLFTSDFISGVEYHPNQDNLSLNKQRLDIDGYRVSNECKIPGIGVQAAVLCSKAQHPFLKEMLEFYSDKSLEFILSNNITAPTALALNMEKYGWRYKDIKQELSCNIHLYPSSIISHYNQFSSKSYCVHFCAGSWTGNNTLKKKLMTFIKSNRFLFITYSIFYK